MRNKSTTEKSQQGKRGFGSRYGLWIENDGSEQKRAAESRWRKGWRFMCLFFHISQSVSAYTQKKIMEKKTWKYFWIVFKPDGLEPCFYGSPS